MIDNLLLTLHLSSKDIADLSRDLQDLGSRGTMTQGHLTLELSPSPFGGSEEQMILILSALEERMVKDHLTFYIGGLVLGIFVGISFTKPGSVKASKKDAPDLFNGSQWKDPKNNQDKDDL